MRSPTPSCPRAPARPGAFTLVELLVVISVIAVLAALLVPALSQSLQRGKSANCLANLRQLVMAAHSYVDGNDGYLPPAWLAGRVHGRRWSWDFSIEGTGSDTRIYPGLLWQGQTDLRVHQCPSFRGPSMTANDPWTGYNYNTSYLGGEGARPSARLAEVVAPSRCAAFGDGEYEAGANKFMRAPFDRYGDRFAPDAGFWGRLAGTQGFRHLGRTNAAFCDGSADSLSTAHADSDESPAIPAPGTGFLSPDNSRYAIRGQT